MTYAKRKQAAIVSAELCGHDVERKSETDTRWQFQGRCRKCGRTVEVPRREGREWFKPRNLDTPCVPRFIFAN